MFEIKEIVKLNSGSPELTVIDKFFCCKRACVICVVSWFDGDLIKQEEIPEACLTKV